MTASTVQARGYLLTSTVASQKDEFLFDAFLSYSHAADGALAPSMQTALERVSRPWYRLRSLRVFRDATNLSLNPHLWTSIQSNLEQSKWLILLASKESARSRWVTKEVEWWLENRSIDNLLLAVTDGDFEWDNQRGALNPLTSSAIHPLLHSAFSEEPFFADLRWARKPSDVSQYSTRFRSAIIDIAATIRGIPKDVMDGEAVRTLRRNRFWAAGSALALVAISAWALLTREMAVENAARTAVELHAKQVIAVTQTKNQAQALPLAILAAGKAREQLPEFPVSVLSALRYGTESSRELRRWRTGGQVQHVVFEPDGKHLLTVMRNNEVLRWSIDGSRADFKFSSRKELNFDQDQFSIGVTQSQTAIITESVKGRYRAWALDGTALASGRTLDTKLVGVAPRGRTVYSINRQGQVHVHVPGHSNPVLLSRRSYAHVAALHVTSGERWLLVVHDNGIVDAIDQVNRRTATFDVRCHEASGISTQEQVLVVAGCGQVHKIDLGTLQNTFQEHPSLALVKEISVDSHGRFIISHTQDDRVDAFTENGFPTMDSILGVEDPSIAISPDGTLAATGGYLDGTVQIFDLSSRTARNITPDGKSIAISTLDVCKDRPQAYWGTQSGEIYQVNYLENAIPPSAWKGSEEYIEKIRCLPGSGAVIADRGGSLTYWKSRQDHQVLHIGAAGGNIAIAVTHTKRKVFLPTSEGVLGWSLDQEVRPLQPLRNPLSGSGWWQVIIGDSDRTLIIGNDTGDIAGIDPDTGNTKFNPTKTLWSNTWTLAPDTSDRGFISAGAGTEIKAFNWTGAQQFELRTDRFIFATDAAFISASNLVAVPTMSGEVLVRDSQGNAVGPPLRNVGSNQFVYMRFSNDGYLLTGGLNHSVVLHEFSPERLLRWACQLLRARSIPDSAGYLSISADAMAECNSREGF